MYDGLGKAVFVKLTNSPAPQLALVIDQLFIINVTDKLVANVIAETYFGNSGNSCLNLQSSSSLSVDSMSSKHTQFSVKKKVCFLVCFSPCQFKVQSLCIQALYTRSTNAKKG